MNLQRTAGNRAVVAAMRNRVVSRSVGHLPDRPPSGPGRTKADGGPEEAALAGEAEEVSGTIPDKEPVAVEAFEKGAGELKEDGPGTPRRGRPGPATPGGTSSGGALRLVPGAVDVDVRTPEVDDETGRPGAAEDSVAVGAVPNTFANPDTSPSPKAFGSESFKAGYKGATFATAGDVMSVSFTLDIQCPWGTNGGGKTDVASAADPAVTKDSYPKIVSDLTPTLKEKSWRAPRSTYWSEAICKRHERFHSTDDKAWAEGAGKEFVKSYLAGKTVNKPTAEAEMNTHLANAMKAMNTANFQFYTGGAGSYLSYAGEERAFGDGKQPYLDLAAAVKVRGEELKAAAATPTATVPT